MSSPGVCISLPEPLHLQAAELPLAPSYACASLPGPLRLREATVEAISTSFAGVSMPVYVCTTAGSEEAIRDKLLKENRENTSKVNISEERKADRAQLISEQVKLSALQRAQFPNAPSLVCETICELQWRQVNDSDIQACIVHCMRVAMEDLAVSKRSTVCCMSAVPCSLNLPPAHTPTPSLPCRVLAVVRMSWALLASAPSSCLACPL